MIILSRFELTYKPFGARSILIEWPQIIDENVLKDVLQFKTILENTYIESKVYIKSAYNSLLITYYSSIENIYSEISILKQLYGQEKSVAKHTYKLWKIPVCYEDVFGLDIEAIAAQKKLSKEQLVKLHSEAIYTVYFLGFLPGFLYLGGLDEKLHFPRRASPRLKVEKGAVAIGGNQTGVYPDESPGGWNIIGNAPVDFFDTTKALPCFAKAGDKLQFYPVSLKKYKDIKTLVDAGVYQLESEVWND